MKVIVELVRYEEGDQISLTTSCGATVCQALRSNSTYQQAMMKEWADEQESFSRRRLIWEINYDLANTLLGANYVAGMHGNWWLPQDLIDEICHRFPDLKQKHGLTGGNNGKRDADEGSRQSGQAEGNVQAEEAESGDCRRPDQAPVGRLSNESLETDPATLQDIRLAFNGDDWVVAKWSPERVAYQVHIPNWANRDAIRRLLKANNCVVNDRNPDLWEFYYLRGSGY